MTCANTKRKAALFAQNWPTKFSTMVERKWNMHIGPPTGPKMTIMHASYHETDLTWRQRRAFLDFLASRETPYMHRWLEAVTQKFMNDRLTETWINSQDFCKDLRSACGVRIVAVFNFPCETEELPDDHYPLAFVLSSV